jgi:hypothetical protein
VSARPSPIAMKRKLVGLLTLIETIGLESEADLRKRNGSRTGLMVETARAARDIAKTLITTASTGKS